MELTDGWCPRLSIQEPCLLSHIRIYNKSVLEWEISAGLRYKVWRKDIFATMIVLIEVSISCFTFMCNRNTFEVWNPYDWHYITPIEFLYISNVKELQSLSICNFSITNLPLSSNKWVQLSQTFYSRLLQWRIYNKGVRFML